MGFWDSLFGQRRPPVPKRDELFRLSTALPDIEDRLGAQYNGRAAVLLRAVEAHRFAELEQQLSDTLALGGRDIAVAAHTVTDSLGFHWIILSGQRLGDALAAIRLVENLVDEGGFGDALTAAAVDFRDFLLVYAYRHGRFYPFAQTGRETRDVAREVRVAAQLEPLLPMERDPAQWYPLWDPPWQDPA
jgi:hypothetical protein